MIFWKLFFLCLGTTRTSGCGWTSRATRTEGICSGLVELRETWEWSRQNSQISLPSAPLLPIGTIRMHLVRLYHTSCMKSWIPFPPPRHYLKDEGSFLLYSPLRSSLWELISAGIVLAGDLQCWGHELLFWVNKAGEILRTHMMYCFTRVFHAFSVTISFQSQSPCWLLL